MADKCPLNQAAAGWRPCVDGVQVAWGPTFVRFCGPQCIDRPVTDRLVSRIQLGGQGLRMTSYDFSEHDDAPVPANEPAANALLDAGVLPQMQTELEVPPEIEDIRKEIESQLALDEPVPPDLLRRYAALWHTTFQAQRYFPAFTWPAGLYIPTDADWRNYWLAAPPPANRYQWQYPATSQIGRASCRERVCLAV